MLPLYTVVTRALHCIADDLRARSLTFCIGLCLLMACQPLPQSKSLLFSGLIMGTDYRITVVAPNNYEKAESDLLDQAIRHELNAVDQSMSTYKPNSEVSRFNRLAANTPFLISESLQKVLKEAMSISALSEGAFDITVGSAVRAWGFGSDGAITASPTEQQIADLKQSSGYQNIILNGNQLSKLHAKTEIDLSAIAKGYAVDQVARMLTSKGLDNYLVDVGGELRGSGQNVDGNHWRVGIEKPDSLGAIQQVVQLQQQAIATSGDYRNYLVVDGKRFSHTIDPTSLKPALHKLALVSVLSDNASTADALATAMMVMGEEKAMQFALDQQLAAYFVIRDNESQFKVASTPKLQTIQQ